MVLGDATVNTVKRGPDSDEKNVILVSEGLDSVSVWRTAEQDKKTEVIV